MKIYPITTYATYSFPFISNVCVSCLVVFIVFILLIVFVCLNNCFICVIPSFLCVHLCDLSLWVTYGYIMLYINTFPWLFLYPGGFLQVRQLQIILTKNKHINKGSLRYKINPSISDAYEQPPAVTTNKM